MEFIGAMVGLTLVWWTLVLTVASLLFSLFWVWMLVDSILRNDNEYPAGGTNEKLVWVLLIALVQFAAVIYYFMVYKKAPRTRTAVRGSHQRVSVQQPPATV